MSSKTNLPYDRFIALWYVCGGDSTIHAKAVFDSLVKYYQESHRHYHDESHIIQCLKHYDAASIENEKSRSVELGIWFHDAIFDPRRNDNEIRSANWFASQVEGQIEPKLLKKVVKLIINTDHVTPINTKEEKNLVDIDLSNLGMVREKFARDSIKIYMEYNFEKKDIFFENQTKFMLKLLSREHIYKTSFFQRHFEDQARKNMKDFIEKKIPSINLFYGV